MTQRADHAVQRYIRLRHHVSGPGGFHDHHHRSPLGLETYRGSRWVVFIKFLPFIFGKTHSVLGHKRLAHSWCFLTIDSRIVTEAAPCNRGRFSRGKMSCKTKQKERQPVLFPQKVFKSVENSVMETYLPPIQGMVFFCRFLCFY
jgi:hypothetical protein